jgi:hypothetical protein
MISSEVQRTLVKSPPELWAELSDPDALARHLGELGEIRIVRTVPESTVEWAAENTTGTISIKPSGWGTKVTLSVTRELPGVTPAAAAEIRATDELGTDADAAPESSPEAPPAPEIAAEPETMAVAPAPAAEPEPRRGFFARLFGRRRRAASSAPDAPTTLDVPTPDAFAAVRRVLEPQTFAAEHPFAAAPETKQPAPEPTAAEPVADADPQQTGDIAAELLAAEEAGAEEATAVLTAVLDRLGAAHHRPFSRS